MTAVLITKITFFFTLKELAIGIPKAKPILIYTTLNLITILPHREVTGKEFRI
ncbi:hypothetical protein D3C85_1683300 [compost metagenome]